MTSRLGMDVLRKIILVLVCIANTAGCARFDSQGQDAAVASAQHLQPPNGEVKILQSWQGDYPTARLSLLPDNQRDNAVGFIGNTETFQAVWHAFKPEDTVPVVDFKDNLLLFVRNIQFYNQIRIGKVNLTNGVAEVLAMETLSAMPIEDKVAMSMVKVARDGITAIQTGNGIIPIQP